MTDLLGHYDPAAIEKTIAEIKRQKDSKRDYVYPAKDLLVTETGGLILTKTETFRIAREHSVSRVFTEKPDAEKELGDGALVTLEPGNPTSSMSISRTAERQLSERLGIPMKYIDRLHAASFGDLSAYNYNYLLHKQPGSFLVRTLDGKVRAILSSAYRVLDNYDLFFSSFQTLKDSGARVWKTRLWEDGFEMFAVAEHIAGEVTLDRTFDPGDGWQSRWYGKEGDAQNAAITIRNSETGLGGLTVSPAVMRRVCANFCVWGDNLRAIHLGRRREETGIVYAEDTQVSESQTTWLKVRDTIKTAFDPVKFQEYIDKLNGMTKVKIENPKLAVGNVVKAFNLPQSEEDLIIAQLYTESDLSQYGLVNAVTSRAHVLDASGNPEQASLMEQIGGKLVGLKPAAMLRLTTVEIKKAGELVAAAASEPAAV